MKSNQAIQALAALAQEHRLAAFRLLVEAGAQGMPAGKVAEALGIPNSSLSFHLGQLAEAGIVHQRRERRSLIYTADFSAMRSLVDYLSENCCGGADCEASPAAAFCGP